MQMREKKMLEAKNMGIHYEVKYSTSKSEGLSEFHISLIKQDCFCPCQSKERRIEENICPKCFSVAQRQTTSSTVSFSDKPISQSHRCLHY